MTISNLFGSLYVRNTIKILHSHNNYVLEAGVCNIPVPSTHTLKINPEFESRLAPKVPLDEVIGGIFDDIISCTDKLISL